LWIRAAESNTCCFGANVPGGIEAYFEGKARDLLDIARHLDSSDD
jgi:hypothetical protein